MYIHIRIFFVLTIVNVTEIVYYCLLKEFGNGFSIDQFMTEYIFTLITHICVNMYVH